MNTSLHTTYHFVSVPGKINFWIVVLIKEISLKNDIF